MTCRVDESQLTGEADDVLKDANKEPLLLSGSKVLEGNGRALVIAVGPNSQAGIIAGLAQGSSEESGGLRQASTLPFVFVGGLACCAVVPPPQEEQCRTGLQVACNITVLDWLCSENTTLSSEADVMTTKVQRELSVSPQAYLHF